MENAVIGLIGVIVGLLAGPLQAWVTQKLNKKQIREADTKKTIEECHNLLLVLDEKMDWANTIIIFTAIYNKDPSFKPENYKNESGAEKDLNRLKFILQFQLGAPTELIDGLVAFLPDVHQVGDILLHLPLKQMDMTADVKDNSLNQVIHEMLEKHGNDPVQAASAWCAIVQQEVNTLKAEIEKFLIKKYQEFDDKAHTYSIKDKLLTLRSLPGKLWKNLLIHKRTKA